MTLHTEEHKETWTNPLIPCSKVFGLTYTQQTSLTPTLCGRSLIYSVVYVLSAAKLQEHFSNKQQTLLLFTNKIWNRLPHKGHTIPMAKLQNLFDSANFNLYNFKCKQVT